MQPIMFCSNCGKEIPVATIFCPFCGVKQIISENLPVITETYVNKRKDEIDFLTQIKTLCDNLNKINLDLEITENNLKEQLSLEEKLKNQPIRSITIPGYACISFFLTLGVILLVLVALIRGWGGPFYCIITLLLCIAAFILPILLGEWIAMEVFPVSEEKLFEEKNKLALKIQTHHDEKCIPLIQQKEILLQKKSDLETLEQSYIQQGSLSVKYIKDSLALECFIQYFSDQRVDSFKEAINLFETEKTQKERDSIYLKELEKMKEEKEKHEAGLPRCPKCGSIHITGFTEVKTYGSNYDFLQGCCCGTILFPLIGPLGFLCGLCGAGKNVVSNHFYKCLSCGAKFRL